jgi:hypothetical protein
MSDEKKLTEADLAHFTGTVDYYRHWTRRLVYTDGIKYMADKGAAHWLVDIVASYQTEKIVVNEPFQCWTLTRKTGHEFVVEMNDGNTKTPIVRQEIPYSDFPLDTITMYFTDGVLMLPTEY